MNHLPPELIYSIIDVLVAEEAGWHQVGYDERIIITGIYRNILPCMMVSRALYKHLSPVVFRHIYCSSAERVRGFHERLIENPKLACYVQGFTVEASRLAEEPWMRLEPALTEVLEALAARSLESLSFIVDALERLRWDTLPVELKSVLHQLVGRHGTVKKLCLWNVELSERLVDDFSGSLQFLECVGVTIHSARHRRKDSASSIPPAHINTSNIRTLAMWGSADLVSRMCVREDAIRTKAKPAFPRLKKIVLPSPYIVIERNRVEWIKMNAPKLDSIRLPLRPGQYEEYFNIDRLCAHGPFRHVEILHEIDLRPCLIPRTSTIQYFNQVSEPSNLESVTIITTYPKPVLGVRSSTPPTLTEPVQVNQERIRPSLLQILENPFYEKLRRVTLDFRDLFWHHQQLSIQIEPQIRSQFPEGLYKDRFVVELRF